MSAPRNPCHSWILRAGRGPAPPSVLCQAAWVFLNWRPPLGLPTCPLQEHNEFCRQPSVYFRQVPASARSKATLYPTSSLTVSPAQSGRDPGSPSSYSAGGSEDGTCPKSCSTQNLGMLCHQLVPSPPKATDYFSATPAFIPSVPDPWQSQPPSPTDLHTHFRKIA